jgi:hypothetical protein
MVAHFVTSKSDVDARKVANISLLVVAQLERDIVSSITAVVLERLTVNQDSLTDVISHAKEITLWTLLTSILT